MVYTKAGLACNAKLQVKTDISIFLHEKICYKNAVKRKITNIQG